MPMFAAHCTAAMGTDMSTSEDPSPLTCWVRIWPRLHTSQGLSSSCHVSEHRTVLSYIHEPVWLTRTTRKQVIFLIVITIATFQTGTLTLRAQRVGS